MIIRVLLETPWEANKAGQAKMKKFDKQTVKFVKNKRNASQTH